ncbi:hypothetical protein FOS14_13465 [Skermania sp. ID1734]|uniref:DUF5313 family protein n=1 Tax=Skermania sp. ID1734 TaxID=2597516 RepID=UPI00117DC148|nr:DUF5313 family protein [Skermania sp. ID1734]TSD99346.1 hypothetical protein FOS14_13465 [Skermania sp. ID1734]
MKKPTMTQRLAYYAGRTLPPDLNEWVQYDLVGHGANERYLARFVLPIIPFFCLVLLFPGPMILKIGMIVMMIVPLVVFTVALSYVWRRYRLARHGLDPHLADKPKFSSRERDLYQFRYGHQ